MEKKSRFIIKRTDKVRGIDDIVLESEGLTIGRLTGNDLVLNHRAVSRTHAGIKDIDGEFRLFNLSQANGTLINGQLVERQATLSDGDIIQIGPFVLTVNYIQKALQITVEMDLEVVPLEAQADLTTIEQSDSSVETMLIKIPTIVTAGASPARGTKKLSGTQLLSKIMPEEDQAALDIFWEKRKREAGKIAGLTPLHPRGGQKLGRAQNNWKPTFDLRKPWRKSYFAWGALVVAVLSVAAFIVYENYYSPGDISDPHFKEFSKDFLLRRNIANDANASCSTCHGISSLQQKCEGCHTTQPAEVGGQMVGGFSAEVYTAHEREGVSCSECHTEHQGVDIQAGLLNYGLCYNCHNGEYRIRVDGKIGPAGSVLPIPHGGTVGYPVENGKWTWKPFTAEELRKKRLPETWASIVSFTPNNQYGAATQTELDSANQFHAIHSLGKMSKMIGAGRGIQCFDCHSGEIPTAGARGSQLFRESTRDQCAKCHGVSYASQTISTVQANCSSCHAQHNRSEDLVKFVGEMARDGRQVDQALRSVTGGAQGGAQSTLATTRILTGVGGAGNIRQNKDTIVINSITFLGGIPWYAWVAMIGILPIVGLFVMFTNTARRKGSLMAATQQIKPPDDADRALTTVLDLDKLKAEGPPYPHPVINKETCIGCHACVDACPHDVLKIVNGKSTVVAIDQCMEDTSCQVECPTNPKSCIVVNTTKKIPARKVPQRDPRLETNVPGIYMVGDISGTPLIKNAINEGRRVIDSILEDFKKNGRAPGADYDVAIVGLGPGGLSSTVLAAKEGMSYVAFERDTRAGMIQQTYQAGKFVFYTPADKPVVGGVPLVVDPNKPEGNTKELMLKGWFDAMMENGVKINEEEPVIAVSNENGIFVVTTEKGKIKEKTSYKVRKVILAVGNRGAPMKLGVPGEDLKFTVQPPPQVAKHCPKCGSSRKGSQLFCVQCGAQLPAKQLPPFEDTRVQYKLSDPKDYVGKKCVVVGAGNSAIEVAIGLTGFERHGDEIKFTSDNEVTLVVRSDFKGDLALGNKMAVYDCIDAGKIKAFFGCAIKEISENEVVIMHARTKEEKARQPNDYIFALIGGEKPTKFLESMGIKIGSEDNK